MSYPKLYPANEAAKSNAFQTLGIGALGDAISCTVTEERNGEYELEMEYPVDGVHFKDLDIDKLIVAKSSDKTNEQIFRIYKIEKPIDGTVTVNAEHISYLLNKVACLPFEATTAQLGFEGIKDNLQWRTDDPNFPEFPFSFWTDNTNEGTAKIETPTMVRSCLGGVDGSLLDAFKGEYEFDNFTVKLWKDRGVDNNIYLRYGKNITDLTATDDISDVYTGILPYWKGNLTKVTGQDLDGNDQTESVETIVYLTDKLKWSEHTDSFAYPMVSIVDMSSQIEVQDDTSDSDNPIYATEDDVREQLVTLADSYVTDNKGWEPNNNIEVSFAQLWQTEEYKEVANLQRVNMCDTVHIIYTKLGIVEEMKVIKTVYNTLLERYDSMELGEAKSSMTSEMVNSQTSTRQDLDNLENYTKTGLKQAEEHAALMINGKLSYLSGEKGGYVVFDKDSNGSIRQIIVMNSQKKADATNVWVWNQYGFGHMSSYGASEVNLALTMEGEIVADMITVGTLGDGAGNFSLNMQTGDLVMQNGLFKDGVVKITGATFGTNIDTTIDGNGIRTGYIYPDQIWAAPTFYANRNGDGALEVLRDLWINVYGTSTGAVRFYSSSEGTLTCIAANGGAASFWVDAVHVFAYVYHNNTEYVGWINDSGSDRRIKQEIKEIDAEESKRIIMGLKPVSFRFVKSDLRFDDRQSHHGFIAQDVKEVIGDSDWAVWDIVDNEPVEDLQTVRKDELIADLVKVVQDQEKRINDLESRLAKLEELINGNN